MDRFLSLSLHFLPFTQTRNPPRCIHKEEQSMDGITVHKWGYSRGNGEEKKVSWAGFTCVFRGRHGLNSRWAQAILPNIHVHTVRLDFMPARLQGFVSLFSLSRSLCTWKCAHCSFLLYERGEVRREGQRGARRHGMGIKISRTESLMHTRWPVLDRNGFQGQASSNFMYLHIMYSCTIILSIHADSPCYFFSHWGYTRSRLSGSHFVMDESFPDHRSVFSIPIRWTRLLSLCRNRPVLLITAINKNITR